MNFEFIIRIILVLILATGFILTWWVLRSASEKSMKVWFSTMTVLVLSWASTSYFASRSDDLFLAKILYKLNWAAVSLFLIAFYYFFVIHLLRKAGRAQVIGKVIVLIALFLFSSSLFTDWIIRDVVSRTWGAEIIFGFLGDVFNSFSAVVSLLVAFYSLQAYIASDHKRKVQLRFFLCGVFIFMAANLVFNVFSQTFFHSVQYQIFGDFSSIFLLGFTAYSILQHKLLDVRVIAAEALTAILLIILFVRILVGQNLIDNLIDIVIFLFTAIFGVLLVRSVSNEVEQKRELEKVYKKLRQIDERKTEFLNMAAHELRAPLTAIKGYLSMILDGDTGEIKGKTKEFLLDANLSNERMIRLVNNLLDVARIEENRITYQMEPVNLYKILETIHTDFKIEADLKKLHFSLETPKAIHDQVFVDKDRIQEVIINYLSNAFKYTEDGSVSLKLSNPTPNALRLEVSDTGVGISPEEQEKLFHKFYRVKSTAEKTMGTGLGLYISKLLITYFKGEVGVVSEKGKGSTFWFQLPLYSKTV